MPDQKYQLKKHSSYGYLYVDPSPSQQEIESFYKSEFYSTQRPNFNDSQLAVQQKDAEFYNFWREFIVSTVEKSANRKIDSFNCFDIGCGWGETLRFLKQKGANTFGVDPAPEAVEYCQEVGINALKSDFSSLNPFDQKFDFVILQNVLEHLSSPDNVIDNIISQAIEDDGYLIIDVPNEFNSFQQAGQKTHNLDEWWVCPPAHLNYFNASSLESLLTQKGFTIVDKLASFPLEMFLLFGEKYVGDENIGSKCHQKRMAFERNLVNFGQEEAMLGFYRSLAEQNLGRQTLIIAKKNRA
jgi:2-polyprenyl-3-methyl-5-hydroxy-6-metoxy-1,4-benzoquinol methylase